MRTFRLFFSLLFLIISKYSFAQSLSSKDCRDTVEYYPNGNIWKKYKFCPEGIIDTLFTYDKKGRLEVYYNFGPRYSKQPITRHIFFFSGVCREMEGHYTINQENLAVEVGTSKSYWKNGSLMDSIIYDNSGNQIYRARFNKKGNLQFEMKGDKQINYRSDRTIRSIVPNK